MCRQVSCKTCKKATWSGCGDHKNEVLRGVPKNQRCSCTRRRQGRCPKQQGLLRQNFRSLTLNYQGHQFANEAFDGTLAQVER